MNRKQQNSPDFSRWLVIFSLVFAGEMIFSLPFHVARFFRPTMLDVFQLTNTQLGDSIAIYGIMAMLAYFPGGALADRFSARKLMTISLLATGMGGFYFVQIPNQVGLFVLFGYWGVTTIFLFWAAMIKATRNWGGNMAQGKAFGILDGGRGLVAAGAATLAVFLLSSIMPENIEGATSIERRSALQAVIYLYTFLTILAAPIIWFLVADTNNSTKRKSDNLWSGITGIVRNKTVWLQAIIVVCAYSAYKGLDYYSLYAVDLLDMNEVSAAYFVSGASYLRAVSAIAAGLVVDRFSASKVIILLFGLLVTGYFILSFLIPNINNFPMIFSNIIVTFIAVYGLRGVYFALLEESRISANLTGTAVGLISVIGYAPDAFFNSVAGRILDADPGLKGYQHFYMLLTLFAVIGILATIVLTHYNTSKYLSSNLPDFTNLPTKGS